MTRTIKDLDIHNGYIYLMEDNVKTKFYALAHNYESSLNGKGRTLFCRATPATSGPWSSVGSAGRRVDIAWGTTDSYAGDTYTCSIYDWLTTTYFYKFAADVKSWMGKTNYLVSGKTFSTPIFTLSASESVYRLSSRPGGTLLSDEARERLENIFTDFGENIWTRTQSGRASYHHSSSDEDYYYDGVALSGVDNRYWGRFDTTYGHMESWGYLPCFTLPDTLYVYDDFTVSDTPQPTTFGYIGVNGVAREIKKAYIGVNGVARLCQGYNQTKIVTAYNPSTGEIPAWDAAPSHAEFSMPLTAKKSGLLLRSISYRIKGFVAGKARVILRRYGSTTPLVDLSLELIRGYNDVTLNMGDFPLEKDVEYQLYMSAVNNFYPPSVEAEWVVENDLIDIAHGSSYYEDNPKIIFAGTIVLSGAN